MCDIPIASHGQRQMLENLNFLAYHYSPTLSNHSLGAKEACEDYC
jgi:hypothetical protein